MIFVVAVWHVVPKQKRRHIINNDGKIGFVKFNGWQNDSKKKIQGTRAEYDVQFELINGNYLRTVMYALSFLYGLGRLTLLYLAFT